MAISRQASQSSAGFSLRSLFFRMKRAGRTPGGLLRRNVMQEKWKESLLSVLPITLIILALCFFVTPVPSDAMFAFVIGSVLLVVGMGLFNLGTELSMTPIGEAVGATLTKSRKLWLILLVGFLVGALVTISEPDLTVLATQVPSVPNVVLILSVALGVGLFLVIALMRILFRVQMRYLLLGAYLLVFCLSRFVPASFLAMAFDAGGVTTGPMTVPFILALGVGVASIRSDARAESDSFGLVSLCSVGPIITVMVLGLIYRPGEGDAGSISMISAPDSVQVFQAFWTSLPHYILEVTMALLPVLLFFTVFQVTALKLRGATLQKIIAGLVYTFAGLVIFLLGVNVGFMPVGHYLGQVLGGFQHKWILVPIGMLIGWFVVSAEPAVQVLCQQVYDMTAGAVPPKALSVSLSAGVSLSVGLAMLRIVCRIPIMVFLIPGYAIALLLMFFTPPVFTSIAFDSGGVASGPMTATFLLPLAMGACEACGGNIGTNAFGVVAMVAMTPLIAIQVLGLVYGRKTVKAVEAPAVLSEEIIEL